MIRVSKYRFAVVLAIFIIHPLWGFGNDVKPYCRFHVSSIREICSISDTIPQDEKPVETKNDKSKPDKTKTDKIKPGIIKEVPKARKQIKPVALPRVVPIKPKIIKPKIIRRITGLVP